VKRDSVSKEDGVGVRTRGSSAAYVGWASDTIAKQKAKTRERFQIPP